jgi:hypothetical protein
VGTAVADVAVANDTPDVAQLFARALVLAGPVEVDEGVVMAHQCGWLVQEHAYDAAISTCTESAVLRSDGSGAYDNLAAADAAEGQMNAAYTALTDAIGAFEGSVGPDAQPSGPDGFGLSSLLEAQGRVALELHQPKEAVADYARALKALPPGSPDFEARLRGDVRAAGED